ncbi:hypothetical protein SPSIL_040820 [Sporomusa silvacetica DSM 10669]|uniref:NlpC/P60 domain-containing protein n=1 Tax=Sporomusa silvacetica DSM 10669 TaxID=1123289 RepID=A0ABZ3IR21_9FIRM|nr:C40 family peptidase [Sporomusa silvacetica]OZC23406.1 murein DD-endopeptidase MepH precursor [Sporomusa silvacetica DSM 10669]
MVLQVIRKLMIILVLLAIVCSAAAPPAAAFRLTVANRYDQSKTFSVLYYDEIVDKWLCVGWYSVPANGWKEYSFANSKDLPYAYAFSTGWHGGDRSENIQMIVTPSKFRYYQDEPFPEGADAKLVTFGKFDIHGGSAQLVFGGDRKTEPVKAAPAGLGDKIVDIAMQMKGKPYVWGGSTPETGFDCSGLTYYVLGQLGINIERTADLQYHRQESISFRDLLPGDLVFFAWHGAEPEHVGIYIGNGKYIDAQNTSGAGPGATGVVTVSSFDNWNKKYFMGGRRFR